MAPTLVQVISSPGGVGGAEVVMASLATAAVQRGWRSVVLSPVAGHRDDELVELLPEVEYEVRGGSARRGIPAERSWLSRRLAPLEASVVQVMLPRAALVSATLPRRGATWILSHQHGMHFRATGRRVAEMADRLSGTRFHRVVACSNAVEAFLVDEYGYRPERVATIRNGWRGEPRQRDADHPPTIICTARLRPQKDHATLVRAFRRVRDEVPGARLCLVGDGPELEGLRRLATSIGLDAAVDFVGSQVDVWPWLAQADVYALASTYEPLGISVLEGMAAGLPVVVTGVGGVPEVVRDGSSGYLIGAGDVNAFASRLIELLKRSEDAKRMGSVAREEASKHTMAACVDAYFDLFSEVRADRG